MKLRCPKCGAEVSTLEQHKRFSTYYHQPGILPGGPIPMVHVFWECVGGETKEDKNARV